MDDQTTQQDHQTTPPATDDTNAGDLAALQTELENSKAKLMELTQISQHALADLQNFKKRTQEEKAQFISFANASLITDLLPIIDNMDRALTHLPEDKTAREWANGVLAIFKNLEETLKARGLETINTESQPFNPILHEALMTEPGPQDQVIKQLEKGYKIADRVLRRAKVTVGQDPAN